MAETYEQNVGPRCPLCQHLHRADEAWMHDEDLEEMDCEACDGRFAVQVHTTTSWRCEPFPAHSSKDQEQ